MKTAQLQLLTIYISINLWLLIPAMTHCIKREKNKYLKVFWIMFIGLLNILGVLFYWLSHKTMMVKSNKIDHAFKVDQDLVFIGLVFAYQLISIPIILNNGDNNILMMCLIATIMLAFINHYVIAGRVSLLYLMIPFIQVLCIIAADLMAVSNEFKVIILIVVMSILNEYPIEFSKKFAFFPLFLYMGISTAVMIFIDGNSFVEISIYVIRNSITYVLVVGTFYLGRKQVLLNRRLQNMTKELKEKNQKIEEISLLKERSRIAREIHDTLGHTLTGAIIQLEAAKKLVNIDQDKTRIAIEKTQQITRDGFLEVKRAIHALKPLLIEDGNLNDALEALFEKTENECHVIIDHHIMGDDPIDESIKVSLYRIIQESITNSIRHGHARKIHLLLDNTPRAVEVTIRDDGQGCLAIKEGNGLKGIRERVTDHEGQVQINSKSNEGFEIRLVLPKI